MLFYRWHIFSHDLLGIVVTFCQERGITLQYSYLLNIHVINMFCLLYLNYLHMCTSWFSCRTFVIKATSVLLPVFRDITWWFTCCFVSWRAMPPWLSGCRQPVLRVGPSVGPSVGVTAIIRLLAAIIVTWLVTNDMWLSAVTTRCTNTIDIDWRPASLPSSSGLPSTSGLPSSGLSVTTAVTKLFLATLCPRGLAGTHHTQTIYSNSEVPLSGSAGTTTVRDPWDIGVAIAITMPVWQSRYSFDVFATWIRSIMNFAKTR